MKATLLVIDSFGIGALPDAEQYGDTGSNTAGHICQAVPGSKWSNMKALGLGNAAALLGHELPGCEAVENPKGLFGVMNEQSPGKDTTTGHWEISGLKLDEAFKTFPKEYPSFPEALIKRFEEAVGVGTLGNMAASGTAIIEELGEEHMNTGKVIVYTSSDSVFQIAAHEDIVPLDKLYEMCEKARVLCDEFFIGRVIARPFVGKPGSFTRTKGRRDFSYPLPEKTIIDHLKDQGVNTVAVGKIGDIFNEQGIVDSYHDKGNPACLARTEEVLTRDSDADEFIFVNLVDTDMIYGHRRDPEGYEKAVEEVDIEIGKLMAKMSDDDLLIVTADHGCDPTHVGSDHTREYVPLLVYGSGVGSGSLGIRDGFYDIAQSLAQFFNKTAYRRGESFLK